MPFILRSNLISFVLDLLFNAGLAIFCLAHFRISPELRTEALLLWLAVYVPRTVIFFAYRVYKMYPMHIWLKAESEADETIIREAARSAYESPLKTNIFYTFTFFALYGIYSFALWQNPQIVISTEALVAGGFLSVGVGLGAFTLGYPLNMVVTGPIASRLSLVMRQRGWEQPYAALPLRSRVLILAVCLTGVPCFMMLSLHAMYISDGLTGATHQELGALAILCLLMALWALLSAVLFNLTISRPVNAVKEAVDGIFSGESAQDISRVPVSYPDELGTLARGINRMLDQLAESNKKLELQMSELENANDSLTRATKVKGEFLASMSHELRTPLNAIIGFSKILLRKTKDKVSERQFRNLELINKSGKQLLSLVNDILDFEKIEAGRLNIIPEEIDCLEFKNRLLESLEPRIKEAEMELEVVVVEPPMILWTDADRLFQILSNFVVNSIKYAGRGKVVVRFERVEGEIECSVTDEGPGISREEQQNIFDSFMQLSGGKGGVGLGLAIVARLTALMGGRVDITSEPGRGAKFSLYLPASYEMGDMGLGRLQPTGDGPDILVVDDQPDFLELMHGELTEAGFRVHLARSGETALEALKELKPAAILLDIVMPGMGGWETLRQIRSRPETSKIPVVISSVLDDTPVGVELGIHGWLTKPVQGNELQELLGSLNPGKKVLVVDDDEATRDMLGQVLEGMKIVSMAAGSGGEALSFISHDKEIGAVILDLGLPDMDGFEVLEKLRALPGGQSLPVVAYTGRELTKLESERLQASLARVVEKHASNSVTKVVKAVTRGLND